MKICSMILSNERINKAYHRGEFELKVKRGTSLRDAAVMNIMRWAVYEKAKAEFENVHLTYGYITKHTRIHNGIEKSHCADAFCISRNVKAQRLESYLKCKCLQRHTRSLHVCNPKKGGIRRSAVASHWIGKSRLQRYDSVEWNGVKCFIFGSTNGRPILRNIDGDLVTPKPYVNYKEVKFIRRCRYIIQNIKIK